MACIRFYSDFIQKGHNSRKGDNYETKCVSNIFPRWIHKWNFKTLACMVFDERMHTWTDGRTHRWTDNPKPICSVNFFKVGGTTTVHVCALDNFIVSRKAEVNSIMFQCYSEATRTVRESDYSPAIVLSEEKDISWTENYRNRKKKKLRERKMTKQRDK